MKQKQRRICSENNITGECVTCLADADELTVIPISLKHFLFNYISRGREMLDTLSRSLTTRYSHHVTQW